MGMYGTSCKANRLLNAISSVGLALETTKTEHVPFQLEELVDELIVQIIVLQTVFE